MKYSSASQSKQQLKIWSLFLYLAKKRYSQAVILPELVSGGFVLLFADHRAVAQQKKEFVSWSSIPNVLVLISNTLREDEDLPQSLRNLSNARFNLCYEVKLQNKGV